MLLLMLMLVYLFVVVVVLICIEYYNVYALYDLMHVLLTQSLY